MELKDQIKRLCRDGFEILEEDMKNLGIAFLSRRVHHLGRSMESVSTSLEYRSERDSMRILHDPEKGKTIVEIGCSSWVLRDQNTDMDDIVKRGSEWLGHGEDHDVEEIVGSIKDPERYSFMRNRISPSFIFLLSILHGLSKKT